MKKGQTWPRLNYVMGGRQGGFNDEVLKLLADAIVAGFG